MTDHTPTSDTRVVRDALSVGVSVGVSGAAFGVAAQAAGLTVWQAAAMSAFVFTGASQFALVSALAAGAAPVAAVVGAVFVGVRNMFYGVALTTRLATPGLLRPLVAHGTIDETTAVALAQPTRRASRLGFGVTAVTLFVLWNASTALGFLGAGQVADPAAWGLDAAAPAVLLALLAPRLRAADERAVALLAAGLALAGAAVLPAGVPILLSLAAVPLVLLARGLRR